MWDLADRLETHGETDPVDPPPAPDAPETSADDHDAWWDDDLFTPLEAPSADTPVVRARRRRAPWHRRAAFALALIVLFASIPVLGREGYRLVTRSRAGRDASLDLGRSDPNYVEQVESTPTAVIAQTDAEGRLLALTVLALSSDTGGTVMFLPIDAALREARYMSDTISTYYEAQRRKLPGLSVMVGEVLNVGIDRVEGFDDRTFLHWFGGAGNLTFMNPDPMILPDGTELPSGEISLSPAQIGPYLAHLADDEDQFSQYLRHQLVWQAWLDAVSEDPDNRIPASDQDPLTPFIRHLASGNTRFETIPGVYGERGRFEPDPSALDALVLDAVPVPDAPVPGARHRIRVLNGTAPEPPSADVVRALVAQNGTIVVVGNGPNFDRERTEVLYAEEDGEETARELLDALGAAEGEIRLDASQADEADFTVILGRDVTDAAPPTGD